MINANKPDRWKADVAASVDLYNSWFLRFAPTTYRETRELVTADVMDAMAITNQLTDIEPQDIKNAPGILPTLRMATAPPIARDRLVGLAYTKKSLIKTLEDGGLPKRMIGAELDAHLQRVSATITDLLDIDLLPWVREGRSPVGEEVERAAMVIADRLCGAVADPIIRNAQEKRQLAVIRAYLEERGYTYQSHAPDKPITQMTPGTFAFHMTVRVNAGDNSVNIPVDVAVQPHQPTSDRLPVMIEAKSAGDFTNTNKRRKEEATKVRQLRETHGNEVRFILFLCGYFDSGYLGYEAAEGIDWVWEHRTGDLSELGLDP